MLRLLSGLLLATAAGSDTGALSVIELEGGVRYLASEVQQGERLLVFTTRDGQRFSVRVDDVLSVSPWQPPSATPSPTPTPAARPTSTPRPRRSAGTLSVLGGSEPTARQAGEPESPPEDVAGQQPDSEASNPEPIGDAEAYWRQRASEQLQRLEFLERKVAELEARKAGFRSLAEAQVREGYQPLETSDLMSIELRLQPLKRQLERARAEWRRFRQEARQSGALPGWLRPPREPERQP